MIKGKSHSLWHLAGGTFLVQFLVCFLSYNSYFLFSVEKNRHDALSKNSYQLGNSSFKRIKLTPQQRDIKIVPFAVPEAVKKEPVKEVPTKKEDSKQRETIVSKFFSEKPKEKPKEEKPKDTSLPEVKKEVKTEIGSLGKTSPKKSPKAAEKKAEGKFKGKAAPAGSRMITSFFTKAPKSAAPPASVPSVPKTEQAPEKIAEPTRKRPLSEEKSPVPEKKAEPKKVQKKMKMSKKPKIKAGTSRILQVVDEDSSDSDVERCEVEEEDASKPDVVLENEEVREKTPPRPYKEKKKKIITECYRDEDGYDNFTLKEVDCSSEEEAS
uniref:Uncharacterized protein n=1 Tax=Phlebotomus papatasi TaxID=29031 RepID=A0A1B0F079_PHLPP